jgi:DNA-directed RNA polymerase subunit omega
MILLAAKRARQVQSGAKPLVHTTARKPTRIAQEEIRAGVLPYEVLRTEAAEEEEQGSAATPKAKK